MEFSDQIKRKLQDYFISKGAKPYSKGWLKMDCPYCGKHKFGVRISTNQANCFRCGPKGNPLKVIREIEDLKTNPEVFQLLKAFEGTDFTPIETAVKREIKKVLLPESFKLMILGNSNLGDVARSYMRGRGFNITKLSTQGIGYCTKGEYAGFIIFPFYENNQLIYFIGRRFIQLGGEKFKNPKVEDFGIGKSQLTYNVDALNVYTKIHLVESITNCLTVGNQGVGILGKKISNYQKSLIHRSKVKSLSIALDPDAMADAIKLGLEFVQSMKVKIVKLPEWEDVNSIGRKEYRKLEKITKHSSYSDLLRMKHQYEGAESTYS